MNNIHEHSFSELYTISSGISTTKEQAGHGSPFVSFSTVFNNYFLPDKLHDLMFTSEKEQKIYSLKEGDILLTRTSETINELALSSVSLKDYPCATFSGFTKRLRPKTSGIAYHKYLGFYLRGYLFRQSVTNHSIMTLRASFNEEIFALLKLYLPEYEQQVKIGDFLYSIDRKIALNNAINAELETMARTLYEYWFVQFDFPNAEGKPYKSSGGEMVWSDELKREIPKGWRVGKLRHILTENKVSIESESKQSEMYGLDLSIMPSKSICLNQHGYANDFKTNQFKLSKYDLLFGSIRPYLRKAGFSPFDGVVNGSIINFRSTKEDYYSFGLCTLTSESMFQYAIARSNGNGTRMPTITANEILNFSMPFDGNLITRYHMCVYSYWDKMMANINENFDLTNLRDFLLPLLMNGQVRVIEEQ